MSTIVYQNLVSCFEKETATTVKLKLAAAPLTPASMVDMNTSLEYGNWGLLQKYPKDEPVGKTSFYSSSFSRLSAKSLELCTESLGSESGSDVFTDRSSIFSSSCSLIQDSSSCELVVMQKPKQEAKSSANPRQAAGRNTPKRSDDFPPPLSSMCGPTSLQMRRRREGGSLIIDAVEAPAFRNSYLQAERIDGRLRLYFLTSSSDSAVATTTSASSDSIEEEQEQEQECCGEPEETDETQSEIDLGDEESEGGEMNIEMGLEKFQRLSRCKEGGHGSKGLMCSVWKPAAFCVAT